MVTQNLLFFNKKGDQYNFVWNGNFWEGSVLFSKVSEKLFEIEHIFVIEKFLDLSSNLNIIIPILYSSIPNEKYSNIINLNYTDYKFLYIVLIYLFSNPQRFRSRKM